MIQNNSTSKRIFLSPPHMGGEELRFIEEAFESNYIASLGPTVDAFEHEFAEKVGIPYAIAVASGTADMPRLNTLRCPAEFNRVNPGEICLIAWGRHFTG